MIRTMKCGMSIVNLTDFGGLVDGLVYHKGKPFGGERNVTFDG